VSLRVFANTFFCQQETSFLRLASIGGEQILEDLVSTLDRERYFRYRTNRKTERSQENSCLRLLELLQKVLAYHKAK
jgi:hypothetical protein